MIVEQITSYEALFTKQLLGKGETSKVALINFTTIPNSRIKKTWKFVRLSTRQPIDFIEMPSINGRQLIHNSRSCASTTRRALFEWKSTRSKKRSKVFDNSSRRRGCILIRRWMTCLLKITKSIESLLKSQCVG